jgi:hypothetical protein
MVGEGDDPRVIAAGLSEAHSAVLLDARVNYRGWRCYPRRLGPKLKKLGLVRTVNYNSLTGRTVSENRLTPLGLQVRAILEERRRG